MDCDIRWNSCYMMLDRFISYQRVIDTITFFLRSIIENLSPSAIQHLKQLVFNDDEWNHLIALRNVLSVMYDACKLLSGKYYQTLSIVYAIKRGLRHLLSKVSTGPQAQIEDTIKKHILTTFHYHFDEKLSNNNKEAILVSSINCKYSDCM